MCKHFAAAIAGLLLCATLSAKADDSMTQFGRYLTAINKPTMAQTDLLSQTMQVRFPQTVQTIGDAMNSLLKFSGYSLIEENNRSAELKNTLTKPLPTVDRDFGPMSLKEGLITLIGPGFSLVHDPLNRTVNFNLKPQFRAKAEKKTERNKIGVKS